MFVHSAKTVWMIKSWNFVNIQKLHKFNFFSLYLCNQIVFCFYKFWCVISFLIFSSLWFELALNMLIDFNKSFNIKFNHSWILCTKIVFLSTSFFMICFLLFFIFACYLFIIHKFWLTSFWLDIFMLILLFKLFFFVLK